jgi:hypothetical protein
MPIPQKKERRGANLSMSRPALIPLVKKIYIENQFIVQDVVHFIIQYTAKNSRA